MKMKYITKSIFFSGLIVVGLVIALVVSQSPQIRERISSAVEQGRAVLSAAQEPILPDGTFAMVEGDPRVYYIEHGLRRWIPSAETFRLQGFDWGVIQLVSPEVLASHKEGEQIDAQSKIIMPVEAGVLPDLAPFPARDLRLSTVDGRTLLRFTTVFWNQGNGSLELITSGSLETLQHIERPDGTSRDKVVGDFEWHEEHAHYHFGNFADYVFELIKPADANAPTVTPAVTKKTTFCMRDDLPIALGLDGAPRRKAYFTCDRFRQGVSVGWADKYDYTLPDQYVDVQDMPAGLYRLTFVVDPEQRFIESDPNNNASATYVYLDVQAGVLNVIASGSAFETSENVFPDGTLIRGDQDPGVYVTHHNQKRLIASEAIFNSYGYSWSDILWFPQSVVDAIPLAQTIRLTGTGDIYLVNEAGFRRRLLNNEVFASYGFEAADVSDVNQTEFDNYKATELIKRVESSDVLSIATKRKVGTIDNLPLGINRASVHVVNETDLQAYASKVVAEGLNVPWDLAFLPDGDMLVTERPGQLRRIGAQSVSIDIPAVRHIGEGGLMGIALHPNFTQNHLLYLYYTATDGLNRVERFRFENNALTLERVIIEGIASATYHDGGQIAFGPDGYLYITTGDAEQTATAQNLSSLNGKTLRLTADGAVPSDNPFGTAVWSYGHRNAQGIAWDDEGRQWQTEHGRSGAVSGYDELNLIAEGSNYGWPDSQGDTVLTGTVGPVRHSGATTTWAPSGIAYVDGRLFFAGLRGASLYEATVADDGTISDFETHLTNTFGRLRAVVLGPDGNLYVTTSNRDGRGAPNSGDDKVIRVYPDFF